MGGDAWWLIERGLLDGRGCTPDAYGVRPWSKQRPQRLRGLQPDESAFSSNREHGFPGLTTLNGRGGGGGVGVRKENPQVNPSISLGLRHSRLSFDPTPGAKA